MQGKSGEARAAIRQNEQFEIIGQRGHRFDVILRDGKKTVITVTAKEDDE